MSALAIISIVLPAFSLALLVGYMLDVELEEQNERGTRGLVRRKARQNALFRVVEPVLRVLAAHLAEVLSSDTQRKIDQRIVAAGEFLGLEACEVVALSLLSLTAGAILGYFAWSASGGFLLPLLCCTIGGLLPSLQLTHLTKARHKSVDRGLPVAIDMAALCMGAGLDFPGAISHVVENMPDRSSPVRQELERIIQELALGRTRQQAMESLSARVGTEAVNEFVAAVVQAERKGTPLSTVLSTQATALRGRRSVLAEEAAARAGVLLMLPMLMMMGSISLILMGPLLIDMMKGGLM